MPNELWTIPSFLSGTSLFITFVVLLVAFHWLLVFPWPIERIGWKRLGKRGWKIVDYVWLSSGFLALTGSAFQARQLLATSMLPQLESMVNASVDPVKYYSNTQFYDGLLCRKFVRSAFSPPEEEFKRVEKEYDDACAWAHQVSEHVKGIDRWDMVDISSLPKPPDTTEGSISRYEQEMRDGFAAHNVIVNKRKTLQQALKRSDLEEFLVIVAPLLAVIALALRITKVTGEIRLG